VDGPLTRAVREGAICYLDEVVEARQDTTVVLHPLADYRRQLPIERLGVTLDAAPGFGLVVSYNPGYQSVLKDLKDSTRQRMVAIEFGFPQPDVEEKIVATKPASDHDRRRTGPVRARPSAGWKPGAARGRVDPRADRGGRLVAEG
jgi:nitric oxide reductase NorQ protein